MAVPTFLTNVDLSLNELLNAKIQLLASDPGSPVEGQIWYNSTTHVLKYRTNSATVILTTGGGVTSLTVDASSIENIGTAGDPSIRVKALGITNAMLAGSIALAKLATDPLARANHTGTQLAATISDLATVVQAYRLDQFANPTADVSINSHKLTNVTDPSSAQDAATKAYVDATAAGIDWKKSVRAATTAAGTLATSFANTSVIDGVTLATGDRILIKDQASGAENGIYTVNASGAPTRATDADVAAEVTSGLAVFVEEGTVNADSGWVLTNNGAITIGTTALVFARFTGLSDVVAGAGLTKTGNTIDVIAGTGITVNANDVALTVPVSVANGGTNATTAAAARTSLGAVGKYSALIGNGSLTAITITQATHGLSANAQNLVNVTDATTGSVVYPDIVVTPGTGDVVITFATAPASNAYRVTIIG